MLEFLYSFTVLLYVIFLTYALLILTSFLRYPKMKPGRVENFDWHFFIPCRDEAAVIDATIRRARQDFPMAHVWVIDDDSDDETAAIVQSYVDVDDLVHLVQRRRPEARTGKGDALNAAYHQLNTWLPVDADRSRTIVTVIDADGEMAPNALDFVSGDDVFGDAHTGAAQIAVWMKNRDDKKPLPGKGWAANIVARWLLRMQDLEFRAPTAGMQSLRAHTGTVALGGNGQFTRLSALDQVGKQYSKPWHGSLLEDYELGVHVLLAGYKVKHVYDTHVSQEAVPFIRRLLTQRTRWSQGNIQCIRYIKDIRSSEHTNLKGIIETYYYLFLPFLQVSGMSALLLLVGFSIIYFVQNPEDPRFQWENAWGVLTLLIFLGIGPFALWGPVYKIRCEPQTSWPRSILYGLAYWIYLYYMYICLPRAFIRVMRGKTGWSKTRRNAETHVLAGESVAIEK